MPPAFNPLNHPLLFATPRRNTPHSTWHEHIPFGMLMVELLQPKTIVELGTYFGDSYCAFCQAVETLRLPTKCFGIDSWSGDAHVGYYGEAVLTDLRSHHDRLYASFSQLVQAKFEEAANHFSDGTVDLLHLDGCHTYEAVKADFELWLPKVSSRGVVLIHDTFVRERDFGAWRFWAEVKDNYPSLEFYHGHGLGVLAIGHEVAPEVLQLLASRDSDLENLRAVFFKLGSAVATNVQLTQARAELVELRLRQAQLEVERQQLEHASRRMDGSRAAKLLRGWWRLKAAVRPPVRPNRGSLTGAAAR